MDDCEEILRDLYPYLDGELSESARAEIQGHLDDCLDCLHVYDFQAEQLREVGDEGLGVVAVGEGLGAREPQREALGEGPVDRGRHLVTAGSASGIAARRPSPGSRQPGPAR